MPPSRSRARRYQLRRMAVLLALSVSAGATVFAVAAPSRLAAGAARLVATPEGGLELRRDETVLARLAVETPALRRGDARLREVTVDGHAVAEIRIPVRGRASEEVWIGDLSVRPARVIWSGLSGPRDADGEASLFVEVTPELIHEYQTASQVTRCDGEPVRLFPRAWDFTTARFRPIVAAMPALSSQHVLARRGDASMPSGQPLGGFHFVSASTTSAAGADARALAAPTALDDDDPKTVWAEGLGGDGRGEFLTARSFAGPQRVRGLRLIPGDASSPAAFKARNRLKALSVAFGPEPEQRFEVEFPQDPATPAAQGAAPYWIPLPSPIETTCVTVVIRDVYRGTEAGPRVGGGTTAISDLDVFTDLEGTAGIERLVADTAAAADCAARVPLLAGLGAPAVPALAEALGSATGEGRSCLVQSLTRIEATAASDVALAALVGALPGATPLEERMITAVFQRAPQPPVSALSEILNAPASTDEARAKAARALGALPLAPATTSLLAAVGVGSAATRLEVVQALGASPEAQVTLIADAIKVAPRAAARNRLGDLIRVLPALARRSAAEADAARVILRQQLASTNNDFEARARAIMAMGAVADEDGAAELAAVAGGSDDPVVRYLAVRELASAATPTGLAALRRALVDGDPRVRETAAEGLGARRDIASEPQLISGAKQEDWPIVRRAEIEALGQLCGAAGRDLLVRAIERDVDDVRRAALVGLARCKDPRTPRILIQVVQAHALNAALRELAAALIGDAGDAKAAGALAGLLPRFVNEAEADLAIEGVVVASLRALGRGQGPQATAAAAALSRDGRHPYRQIAVETLGQLCDPDQGARALAEARAGSDAALAEAAATAEAHCRAVAATGKPAAAIPAPEQAPN